MAYDSALKKWLFIHGAKFSPGTVVATQGALSLRDKGLDLAPYLERHLRGDWGDVDKHDAKENDFSLEHGFRILSVYEIKIGGIVERLYVLTECDRSVTTFLLASEY